MNANSPVPSTVGATYVEPSAAQVLEPGLKLGDLYQHRGHFGWPPPGWQAQGGVGRGEALSQKTASTGAT